MDIIISWFILTKVKILYFQFHFLTPKGKSYLT